jgi:hypothetical protein
MNLNEYFLSYCFQTNQFPTDQLRDAFFAGVQTLFMVVKEGDPQSLDVALNSLSEYSLEVMLNVSNCTVN